MNEFDKIIGYDEIKEELKQLIDMIHNMSIYEKMGAKMPKGLLIHGVPGVGKSLMARSFIKESGRKSYTIRRNKHDGDFINGIKEIFTEASNNAPSIILLDDMDKFVVDDNSKEEYVAVQACIDDVGFSDVYVMATANDLSNIPVSLLRAGRFDRKIKVYPPAGEDAVKIIQHYMSTKPVERDINIKDIAKMFTGKSCAELETILNEAALNAGFERCEEVTMKHITRHLLRTEYGVSDSLRTVSKDRLEKNAFHEAGHVVINEIFYPDSIGLASICKGEASESGGFVIRCSGWKNSVHNVLMSLAGKAAVELKYGIACDGSQNDLSKAIRIIKNIVCDDGACGVNGLDIKISFNKSSNDMLARQEIIIQAELEKYLFKTKEILIKNMEFLDAIAAALLEKETLLNSDIQKIRDSCDNPICNSDSYFGFDKPVLSCIGNDAAISATGSPF